MILKVSCFVCGWGTLHDAILYNNNEILKLLLQYKADPNMVDNFGKYQMSKSYKLF